MVGPRHRADMGRGDRFVRLAGQVAGLVALRPATRCPVRALRRGSRRRVPAARRRPPRSRRDRLGLGAVRRGRRARQGPPGPRHRPPGWRPARSAALQPGPRPGRRRRGAARPDLDRHRQRRRGTPAAGRARCASTACWCSTRPPCGGRAPRSTAPASTGWSPRRGASRAGEPATAAGQKGTSWASSPDAVPRPDSSRQNSTASSSISSRAAPGVPEDHSPPAGPVSRSR